MQKSLKRGYPRFLGPTWVSPPNGISIGSSRFCTAHPCDQHTDHATCGICSRRPRLRSACDAA